MDLRLHYVILILSSILLGKYIPISLNIDFIWAGR